MSIEHLDSFLQNNEINEACLLIEELADNNDAMLTDYLIKQLELTEEPLIRIQIALTLSDMACQDAVEPIIKLLQDPKTLGYRGSLLYALAPLHYSEHIDLLFELMMTGNFEVSRQSYLLLEKIIDDIPLNKRQEYKLKIKKHIEDMEDKIDFLTDAIDELNL
ncbi:HEAT repeat domain-containing protein [Paenibacillus daejeonensis]|uniref:HEAT repeat domain-containing protein n=1 Tax=Paenibacillus daejeonensis TaxID=135193 RepID=UPI0003726ECD|nr:HEAT repeat domain-containing protein [Paenibacillus daejeonensis]